MGRDQKAAPGRGDGVKAIVRKLGIARNTVRAALRSEQAPKYERQGPGSAVDVFEPAIRRLLATTPDMPATVVAERIGWTRGITVLREGGRALPGLSGARGFRENRVQARRAGPVGPVVPDVLGGHLGLLVELGAVPPVGVYDGEPAISVRRGKHLIYTEDYLRLKGTMGMGSVVLAKGHPEREGVVERTNGRSAAGASSSAMTRWPPYRPPGSPRRGHQPQG